MAQTPNATNFNFYVNVIMNDLESNRTMCQTNETLISSVEFCGITKDLTGCKAGTHVPTLSFTAGSSDSKGTNWLLWGGIGLGACLIVVGVIIYAQKMKGDDETFTGMETE